MLPWATLTAIGGAAIALVAGGGARAAIALFILGLMFVAFLWTFSVPRCPSCGAPLPRRRERPGPRGTGPADAEPIQSCPRCLARFD